MSDNRLAPRVYYEQRQAIENKIKTVSNRERAAKLGVDWTIDIS